jgi:MEMO1 family protein
MEPIRSSAIAGSWYPGNPAVLRRDIEKYLAAVPDFPTATEIVGMIVPHAGYMYSGQVAAHAFKLIYGKKYDVVIVIGPSHRVAFRGVSIFSRGGYETPLGIVPVSEKTAREIKSGDPIVNDFPDAHLQEHSVEIQIPFLQVVLGEFSFVPLVMGDQSPDTCVKLARSIYAAVKDKKVLVVGSSDLSHFHTYTQAEKLDKVVIKHIQESDAEGLLKSLARDNAEACGGGPIVVTMMTAHMLGADQTRLLKYANSGDVTGDKSSVVGYMAAVSYK